MTLTARRFLTTIASGAVVLWGWGCGTPAGTGGDAGGGQDASTTMDGGAKSDAGPNGDAGVGDAGVGDAGQQSDAGSDAGATTDGGVTDGGGGDAGWTFDAGPLFDGGPPLGTPIVATPNTWTWVDFPGSSCDDGSTTGIGINPSATNSNLVLFFEGGGACWSYLTCYILNTAVHGPYGQTQFSSAITSSGQIFSAGALFDRTLNTNPVKDWNFVYVPYCTGDVHAGDNVIMYSGNGTTQTYHHKGHANALAYLERIGATFTAPGKVLVSGSSAGGGGVLSNYAFARAYWPNAAMYLLDDSLPFFEGDNIPPSERNAWIANWNLTPIMSKVCGGNCLNDFSIAYKALRARYPGDRMALLSSEQDATISQYYLMNGPTFQADLASLTTNVLVPANFHTFYMGGNTHTMLYSPASFTTTGGTGLWTWLTQMATDNPNWTSAGP